MGKKKDKEKDKKKKKDKKSKKKDKSKKEKKDKKKKQASSDSSSEGSEEASSSPAEQKEESPKKRKKEDKAEKAAEEVAFLPPPTFNPNLPPPEEGILRFEFANEETPLGVRFSGGFPPLIVAVNPGSFAEKKKIPVNHEVHAINGHAMVPQNREQVMNSLKQRPVTLDVRPLGWKPMEKVRALQKAQQREQAERDALVELETHRRTQVAREAADEKERKKAERAAREEAERKEREELERRAREQKLAQRAKEEEFERQLAVDPLEFRKAAADLMEAEYGSAVKAPKGRRGLPLRLFTRRKEVAWLWAGEVQELIGGGVADSSWSNN